jgi:hypothetical protein
MWPPDGESAFLPRPDMEPARAIVIAVADVSEESNHAVFSGQRQRSLIRHNPQRGARARQV